METKTCIFCKEPIRERADKKFCDDYCRNSFNNNLNRDKNKFIRNINHALRRNRKILEDLLKHELCKRINKEELLYQGFQTKYHTHTLKDENGKTIYYTYDYAICLVEADWVIVKREVDITI